MFEQGLNAYWKTVVDTIQDGIMIVDRGGTIVSMNEAFGRITGYGKEELIGKRCSVLHCDVCDTAREEETTHWCKLFQDGKIKRRKCALRKKDGGYVPILKNASILHDSVGKVMGAVETMTDITEILKKDSQIEAFRQELRAKDGFHGILGTSPSMQAVFDLIANASLSDAPVIIYGESGTGKELVARAIHDIGPRKDKAFVKVNCAALTESLLESELFGHVKGAYTGAYRSRQGRFEAAHQGDIFLDEIGDLPLTTQVKLLRVLEEKVIERVGDNRPTPVDVRIISATNRNLEQLVEKGAFRKDFFFRINVIPISLPPLRERVEDLPILAEAFFKRGVLKSGKEIQGISNEAMSALLGYDWPGNVRELRSAFEYAFVACRENSIKPQHFPPGISRVASGCAPAKKTSLSREEMKKASLLDALKQAGGNQSEAARILGVSRVTVWNRMKRFEIDPRRPF